jgi:hypothetical protein
MRDFQKYAAILALFSTVLYLALVVAALGLISLGADLEVIPQKDAGPLVGPSMTGAAVLLVFIMLLILGINTPPERQRVAISFSFLTGVAAYGIFIAVGAVLYAIGSKQAFDVITFSGSMLLSPFAFATGALAFIVTLVYSVILASHMGERGRPLWPWERRNE